MGLDANLILPVDLLREMCEVAGYSVLSAVMHVEGQMDGGGGGSEHPADSRPVSERGRWRRGQPCLGRFWGGGS